jgi:hypothetical protein
MGVRRLGALIKNLPPDSAISRKALNAPSGWDNQIELLAQTVDALHSLIHVTIQLNSDGRTSLDDPYRVPRPFEKPEPLPLVAGKELEDFLKE